MKIRWSLVLVLIPAVLGLALRLMLSRGPWSNPILFIRSDLGTWALLAGVLLSALLGAGHAYRRRIGREHAQQLAQTQVEAYAERRRFLQRLDHELKNPLTAIQAGLANLDGESPPNLEALESVKTQTRRLSRLVADLRKIAELETRSIEESPIDMGQVLKEAMELAQEQPQAVSRHLSINLPQAPWPLPFVPGDHDLLFLAVYNLLDNALKFTQPGDTIELRAIDEGSNIVIEVADTGPGIPEVEAPHIWQELYRGKNARGVPGSGLGLALVRAIIERHGGHVTMRSRIDQGTVVTIRLPLGVVADQ